MTREAILRTCYLEFKTLARRIEPDIRLRWDLGLPVPSFGSALPYLIRRMEDGSFYTYLTEEDRVMLLGEKKQGGYSPGLLGRFLGLESNVRRVLDRLAKQGKEPFGHWDEVQMQLEISSIPTDVDGFRRYLEGKGIAFE